MSEEIMGDGIGILYVDDRSLRTCPDLRVRFIEAAKAKIAKIDKRRAQVVARLAEVESMTAEPPK